MTVLLPPHERLIKVVKLLMEMLTRKEEMTLLRLFLLQVRHPNSTDGG
jgi:hypothetical protein